MCGICGKYDPRGVSEEEVVRMADSLSHRGPDDCGFYIDQEKNVGLGHRRLSIIDLEGGKQPMSSPDGRLWVVFNGEIYNYADIRKELSKEYRFKTESDTEALLALYKKYADHCVDYLRGMFAFAIYDRSHKKLFIARDHLGQKPLYYFNRGEVFGFASEIKALLSLDPGLAKMDSKALYEYLTLRIITPPRSMFHEIRKLAPGHCATFKNGKMIKRCYWKLDYKTKIEGGLNEIIEQLDQKLTDTVSHHLVSDVPIGAFLSGGIDSSIVVAKMANMTNLQVDTFTGDVPYSTFSEAPTAQLMVNKYRTRHHVLTIKPSLTHTLPDLVRQMDEPSDPLSICLYLLSEMVRKHVKVILGGDGGDELFGGYDRYYGNAYAGYYAMLPELIRKHVIIKLINAVPEGFWYQSLSHKLRWMHQMSFHSGGERYAKSLSYFYFSDGFKKRLYTDQFRKQIELFDPEASIKEYYDSDNADELVDKMLYADSMTRMPDHPNMILDRMTMAHGLEARAPFLDHKLAEFCASIPVEYKVNGRKRRIIQYELAKKYLPSDLIKRKKQGFSSALPYILADDFKLIYKTFLNNAHLVRDGFLRQPVIDELLNEHLGKKMDHGQRLWLLCNAEVWYRMYIENERIGTIRELLISKKESSSSNENSYKRLPR